jgi:hypothetical protein
VEYARIGVAVGPRLFVGRASCVVLAAKELLLLFHTRAVLNESWTSTGILAGDFILTAMMILTLSTTVMVMIEQAMVSRGKKGIR